MMPESVSNTPTAGRMTATMRTMSEPEGIRVLRILIAQQGMVLDDQTIKRHEDVTLGPTEHNTFVVANPNIQHSLTLFECMDGNYTLHYSNWMRGRIVLQTGTIDLAQHAGPIRLDPWAKGKILLSDTTLVLFQFVPLSSQGEKKARLPSSLQSKLDDTIDWTTMIIVAFSFLVHFGAVGALWSDWMDPVIDDDVRSASLVESLRSLPFPPRLEFDTDSSTQNEVANTPVTDKAKSQGKSSTARSGRALEGQPGSGKMSDSAASTLLGQLQQFNLEMAGALGGSAQATNTVMTEGNTPMGLLEQAGASEAGVGRGVAGLSFGQGNNGLVRPGAQRGGLIGNLEQGTPETAGSAKVVKKPVGNAQITPPTITGSPVPDGPIVIAGLTGAFKACYRRGLEHEDPVMQGSVRVTAKIGPNGEVVSATPSSVVGLSSGVVGCVCSRVAGSHFAPLEGGGFAILVIPISFVRQ